LPTAQAAESGAPVRDPDRFIQRRVSSWKALKEQNVVMQRYDFSCGAAAVATLARYFWGDDVKESTFLQAILARLTTEELKDRVENGLTMTDLRKAADACGYNSTMGKRTLAEMAELRVPVIIRIVKDDYAHFVVYRGALNDRVYLADPLRVNIRLSFVRFAQQWTDGVILVIAKPGAKLPEDTPLSLHPCGPLQPELQAARRILFLPPLQTRLAYPSLIAPSR
jgi:predicted double-glycine peptidase